MYSSDTNHGFPILIASWNAVGEGAHIGLNSCIREDVRIGEYAIIGMGAVVLHDVAPFDIVAGNPAQVIGQIHRPD